MNKSARSSFFISLDLLAGSQIMHERACVKGECKFIITNIGLATSSDVRIVARL